MPLRTISSDFGLRRDNLRASPTSEARNTAAARCRPARRDARLYLAETEPELYALCAKSLKHAIPQPDFVGMRRHFAVAGKYLSSFLRHRMTPEQCLRHIEEDLARLDLEPDV